MLAEQLVTERAPAPLLLVPDGTREMFETWQTLFPVPTFPLLDRPFRHAFDVRDRAPVRVGAAGGGTIVGPVRRGWVGERPRWLE